MQAQTVYDFVKSEEANFKASPIEVVDGMKFSFYDTVRTATLYKNSNLLTGKSDDKPVKNITLPLLRLQYRSEGFDVKDVNIYVDDPDNFFMSFLVKKFHEKWARENQIDTFIDEVVESYVDYGLALTKDIDDVKPEVIKLPALAFCDQTNILSGPLCIKHSYSPDELRQMEKKGWENITEVIQLAGFYKVDQTGAKQNQTPGKYIEVYELHGTLPEWWLGDKNAPQDGDPEQLVNQLQIVTFYTGTNGDRKGITLFAGKETESPFDNILRDPIYGRALGLGGAEELFEAQVWTTYDVIRMKNLLDAAAKVLYQTTDAAFANRNKTSDLESGEILIVADNKQVNQINTTPVNMPLFERAASEWEIHAQQIAGASDALLGDSPSAGTPFALQAAIIQQGQQIHQYRQGKIAVFFEKLYRERFLPYIAKEITKGSTFLSELSLDELHQVADSLVTCQVNDLIKEKILNGEEINPQEVELYKVQVKEQFMKGGNQKFIEILKNEMKEVPLSVRISIKGKQQDFAGMVDKLSNIMRTIMQAPQILQDPTMAKLFNEILEYSGLEPLDFSGMKLPQPQDQTNPQGQTPTPGGQKTPAPIAPTMATVNA